MGFIQYKLSEFSVSSLLLSLSSNTSQYYPYAHLGEIFSSLLRELLDG